MDSYLVTGAMGFIGSHLCMKLLQQGEEVWGIDIAEPPYENELKSYDNFHFVKDSINNRTVLEKLVSKSDCVCHLAALPNPSVYVDEPLKIMNITLKMSLDLIDICQLRNKLFFYTSTSEVYGRNPDVPWSEDSDRVLGPSEVNRWCYSSAKASVEHYLRASHDQNYLDYICVRPFNVYGPRLRGRVVHNFIRDAMAGRPLTIHGDGKQTRCFTYIDDTVESFIRLLKTPTAQNKCYNIGSTRETSITELAETIGDVTDTEPEIVYEPYDEAYGEGYEDVRRRVPDVSRVKATIDWEAKTALREGLKKTHEYESRIKNR